MASVFRLIMPESILSSCACSTVRHPLPSTLFRALDIDAEITFIRLKSYEGTGTTGVVKQIMGLSENLEGRHVIIVEDIIDTGYTMQRLHADIRP